ncbi:hypothetical protein UPYG_G00128700 [Umbra pygmaea]|uniref:Transient receptor ion channel domain-containing protein n=1 Tax=Umbra pygmaea TaxID=75934 RepID=A0ABD0XU11_UMBPY
MVTSPPSKTTSCDVTVAPAVVVKVRCLSCIIGGQTALLTGTASHCGLSENENLEIIELLLSYNVYVGDALLHAIRKEVVGAVDLLLNHKKSSGGMQVPPILLDKQFSDFTPDITPIILAAHTNNYEVIKLLVQKGVAVPQPHEVRCNCVECVSSSDVDSLRHSRSRLNIYRALSSPSLIALSSEDPFLTAFRLSWELEELSKVENEFKSEYEELSEQCKQFAKDLLDQTRSSRELEMILNYKDDINLLEEEENNDLARLKLAIKYHQKAFVAQPNCQQLLASRWYDEFPGWRRRHWGGKFLTCVFISILFPVFSLCYLIAPKSRYGLFIRKPFIKFICHTASYLTFLFLLLLASQHIVDTDPDMQGPAPTTVEWMILPWVLGFIWTEIKQMWDGGFHDYIHDWWNLMDFVMNSLYLATISLKLVAYTKYSGCKPRSHWDMWHPTLVAEAVFAIANIFSSLRLISLFTANSHLGPLQISLGRMLLDILKFLFIYCLVLLAFANGLNQLYFYYETQASEEKDRCKGIRCVEQNNAFSTLFETLQSLFWSIFGLISLYVTNVNADHQFTEFVGATMFGTYNIISLVVLLNMLIAMMNNSYQHIADHADIEWKFARTKLWMSYFEEGGTLPSPFNIVPSPKSVWYLACWIKRNISQKAQAKPNESFGTARELHCLTQTRAAENVRRNHQYQEVLRNLVKRYVAAMIRDAKTEEGLTEDNFKSDESIDNIVHEWKRILLLNYIACYVLRVLFECVLNELKQDISSFRYEVMGMMKSGGAAGVGGTSPGLAGVGGGGASCLAYPDRPLKFPTTSTGAASQPRKTKNSLFSVTASILQQSSATPSSTRPPEGMGVANGLVSPPSDGGLSSGSSRAPDRPGQRKDFPRDITDFGLFQKRQRSATGATVGGAGTVIIYPVSEESGEMGESDGEAGARKGKTEGGDHKGVLENGGGDEGLGGGEGKYEEEEMRESFLHQESGADENEASSRPSTGDMVGRET